MSADEVMPSDAQVQAAAKGRATHPREPHTGGTAGRLNWLRAAVLGANDGIVSVAGIVIGVAGATTARGPLRLAAIAELTGAIATSGTYERGGHLIDPQLGRPAARAASASVTGPDLGLADALATAVAVAGEPGLDLIDTIEGYEALVIGPDGRRRWTSRFPIAAAGTALSLEHRDQHVPA